MNENRHLMLVGRQKGDVIQLAAFCAWGGGHPMTPEDEQAAKLGAPVSHGICREHRAEHFPDDAA